MSRSVDGSRRKDHRKKILEHASGFRGRRHTNFKAAKDAVAKALTHAYRDRRDRKGDFRQLWITRINAACRLQGITYSRFVEGCVKASILVDRKMLADMAIRDSAAFSAVVERAKAALAS
jgi:large subunit ribosomal protein L20